MTARDAAVGVLMAVEARHSTLAGAIDQARRDLPDPRERGLLLEIAAGTLRWQRSLDALIEARSGRPVAELQPEIRAVLRMTAFQIEHLDRVPAHAAVHEAVSIARARVHEGAAKLVNAVARRITRGGPDPRPADPGADAATEAQLDYLEITLSHPRWLAARWLARHGYDAARAWCRFNDQTPDVTVRATTVAVPELVTSLHEAGLGATPGRWADTAVTLPPGALSRVPPPLAATFVVQDEGSQVVGDLAAAAARTPLLDLCAAPGGKTAILRARHPAPALVVASDFRRARVRQLRGALASLAPDVPIVQLDGRAPLPFAARLGSVFIDAPCTGLGTVRRDPDVKWARSEADLASMADVQGQMLARAAACLAPGGRLIYATCSSEPEENDEVVARFCAREGFRLLPAARFVPPRQGPLVDGDVLRTRPDLHGLDAFFAAVLVRPEGA
jgi:16S rRNA (cytosine967-C5)-methyltransferase